MMRLDKDTTLCISIARRPSNFGTTLHNAAYQALGLNFLYKAFGICDLAGAVAGVRALGIRGCSVSMPFKEAVLQHLDALDEAARAIGAVNTVVNEEGRLVGYNTDAIGARVALQSLGAGPDQRVLLLGAGGVARAIVYALHELGFTSAAVAARDGRKVAGLPRLLDYRAVPWSERGAESLDLLINATSVGMVPEPELMPVPIEVVERCGAIMDVVLSPMHTRLASVAESLGKRVAPGYLMSLHQAAAQFRLYTGRDAPMEVLRSSLEGLLNGQAGA